MSTLAARFLLFPVLTVFAISTAFSQGSSNVTLLAQLDNYSGYNDCWGYTAPDGREYALLGVVNGTSIVDITDAPTVDEIAFIPSATSTWKDIKTYRHYAYAVNESGGGMQIIDLSDLPNSATLIGAYTGFTTSHNIYIDTTTAICYAEGSSGSQSVRVISLADPVNPVQLTTFGVECHDIYAQDNRAYIAEGFQGTVGVYDVTNPAAPVLLRRIGIPAGGYVHNCWTTEDGNYLMTTEETTGRTVKMWDIQDLDNAFITDTYLGPSQLAHNVLIKGNFAYIAHYADGLKIVDITDPFNIVEIGFYDTHSGTSGFVGAWGTFPFFESGKVLVSDISNGLFVLEFDDGSNVLSCDDISSFQARCISGGTIQARIILNSTDFTGQTVDFLVDEDVFTATIQSRGTLSRAQISAPGYSTGTHTVSLADPAGCFTPMVVTCPGSLDKPSEEWADDELDDVVPSGTALLGSFPNPFNPSTTIRYSLSEDSRVTLKIYNALGQEIATLVDGLEAPGFKEVVWNGTNSSGEPVSSGIYYARMVAGDHVTMHKLLLMK